MPSPYYFQGNQPNIFVGPTPGPDQLDRSTPYGGSFGIAASSIANVNTGAPYKLNTAALNLPTNTLDDPFNPRTGVNGVAGTDVSRCRRSARTSSSRRPTLSIAKFFPMLKRRDHSACTCRSTGSTGVIPPSILYTFSDQQMRGYNQVFYATDACLGQIELRQPLALDRRITLAVFVDELDYRIRGAYPLLDPYTNRIVGYPGELGALRRLRRRHSVRRTAASACDTVRIDFAKGANGTHTSFGIGQSF